MTWNNSLIFSQDIFLKEFLHWNIEETSWNLNIQAILIYLYFSWVFFSPFLVSLSTFHFATSYD